MAGKISDVGERRMAEAAIDGIQPLTMHLAKASFDDEDELEPGDFTEADYPGYAPITLTFSGLEPGNPGGKAVAEFDEAVFTCGGSATPNRIYGYWIENSFGEAQFWELFAGAPRPMLTVGQQVKITFSMRLWSPL